MWHDVHLESDKSTRVSTKGVITENINDIRFKYH